jgi:hypothetical protein
MKSSPLHLLAVLPILALTGCPIPGGIATISYHQTGACNGGQGQSGDPSTFYAAGTNQAYVLFGVEKIDNSGGTEPFNFDPTLLFVNSTVRDFVDPSLMIYKWVLFAGVASQAQTVPAGAVVNFSPSGQNALVVQTTAADGSSEALVSSYSLQYNTPSGGPGVVMSKTNSIPPTVLSESDCGVLGQHLF